MRFCQLKHVRLWYLAIVVGSYADYIIQIFKYVYTVSKYFEMTIFKKKCHVNHLCFVNTTLLKYNYSLSLKKDKVLFFLSSIILIFSFFENLRSEINSRHKLLLTTTYRTKIDSLNSELFSTLVMHFANRPYWCKNIMFSESYLFIFIIILINISFTYF